MTLAYIFCRPSRFSHTRSKNSVCYNAAMLNSGIVIGHFFGSLSVDANVYDALKFDAKLVQVQVRKSEYQRVIRCVL